MLIFGAIDFSIAKNCIMLFSYSSWINDAIPPPLPPIVLSCRKRKNQTWNIWDEGQLTILLMRLSSLLLIRYLHVTAYCRKCCRFFDQIEHIWMIKTKNKMCLQTRTSRNKFINNLKINSNFMFCFNHPESKVDWFS